MELSSIKTTMNMKCENCESRIKITTIGSPYYYIDTLSDRVCEKCGESTNSLRSYQRTNRMVEGEDQ